MEARRCEFVDSRLRPSPPDREDAALCGQAGENEGCFPRLVHRSAAAHKLHSATATEGLILNLFPGIMFTTNRETSFSLFSPGTCPTHRHHRRDQASRQIDTIDLIDYFIEL